MRPCSRTFASRMCEVSSWSLMFATALFLVQAAFQSPRLVESSGVAVSRAYPGVLWTHNDSGDGPYLYATDLRGTDRGALLVPGAQAIDWEDMSLGPCPLAFVPPARSCIYLADTGDNLEFRPFVTVYAIPEPPPPERAGETLGIRPSPEAGRGVTAGAIRADGRLVALRTYSEIYLFYAGVGGRLLPARARPCNIAGLEIGGEAIDFLDDSTFVLTSEASSRRRGRIDTVTCSP